MAVRDLTSKERILLHLFEFYRLADEYTVPEGVTQSGIAKGVGIRVQHVTQSEPIGQLFYDKFDGLWPV